MRPIVTIFETIHQSGIDELCKFADVKIACGVSRDECMELSKKSDAIIIKSSVQVDKELLDCSPSLRIIARAGVGVDNIDITEAEKHKVKVLTVPGGNSTSAAEFTLMQILLLCRRLPEVMNSINRGDFRRHLLEGRELCNMTVGLVGLGNVGMLVFERLKSFGCNIIGYDPYSSNIDKFADLGGIYHNSFDDFLSEVDILSFHAKLTLENHHMMGKKQFSKVKKGLLLVNNSRANLIDQKALLESVENNTITAASLDVLSPEPPFEISPEFHGYQHSLLNHPKIYVTPHIGASTFDAQERISLDICEQILNNLED